MKHSKLQYAASVTFAGSTFQVCYYTPRELVRALRDLGRSTTANLVVRKIYVKGVAGR